VNVAATLPLAVVMIAGPQIISAFFFATSEKWKGDSAAYILGAAVSILAVVTIAYFAAKGIKSGTGHGGSKSRAIDYVIVALLLVAMAYVFDRRKQTEPPKWMGKLETATARFSFTLGFLLLGFFPSDLITSVVVGAHLANHGDPWWHGLPFVVFTLLLLALPALLVLALGQRAERLLPRIRDWMGTNSWIVSEIVLAFFIVIVLTG
jgi:small neutral amino acid transporter SnatA (MarC family)